EDAIPVRTVTAVQTCALPIFAGGELAAHHPVDVLGAQHAPHVVGSRDDAAFAIGEQRGRNLPRHAQLLDRGRGAGHDDLEVDTEIGRACVGKEGGPWWWVEL